MNQSMYSSDDDSWGTPDFIFQALDKIYGPFDLDPASDDYNYKCTNHFTRKDNGLKQQWDGHSVFLNPPYGDDIIHWVNKCCEERSFCKVICALLPGRTDSVWFHNFVLGKANELLLIKGRIKFEGALYSAPFPSVVAVYHPTRPEFNLTHISPLDFRKL